MNKTQQLLKEREDLRSTPERLSDKENERVEYRKKIISTLLSEIISNIQTK